ncbi:MAG TPA: O-antigen ligase family protein [Blastocatellia bacterium]|nr:O-antigen ligase family protein [Blastocatellia bacterium]
MAADKDKNRLGALFASHTAAVAIESSPATAPQRAPSSDTPINVAQKSSSRFAFTCLYLFTMMLYIRPNDILPIGAFPLVKIVAILMLIAYIGSKISLGEPIMIWPLEMKMLAVIVLLGIIFTPISVSPMLSVETLTDSFFKVVSIFILIINLIDSRERLRSLMKLVVVCGTIVALGTVKSYFAGELVTDAAKSLERAAGQGFFANPNELAMALNLLLPFAVVFGLTSKGMKRLAYFACAGILSFGVVVSFSRGGFLGLVALGGVIMWKAGRGKRATTVLAGLVLCCAFVVAMPSGYSDRLFTILHTQNDQTRSAQERQELFARAVEVIMYHPVIGVGVGNFGIYSLKDKVAHNAYLEIAAELGVVGFIAYMVLIFAPLRTLKRIERETYNTRAGPHGWNERERETYFLSIGLQAVLVAYMVCSFFQSSQYFWYLYYIVAYTVSLKRIRINEAIASSSKANTANDSANAAVLQTANGALWETTKRGVA